MAKKSSKASKSALSLGQIRKLIDLDEPDYEALAKQLGTAAIPHLQTIVKGSDPMLASKAAYLVSLIPDSRSAEVLAVAAKSPHATVRVAAASAARNLQQTTNVAALMSDLLKDPDLGVRKVALRSIEVRPEIGPKDMVMKLATNDPDDTIRDIASQLISHMP
jgi:HEAT repeat protein